VDTLNALKGKYNNEAKLYLIIGMDQMIELHTWKEPEKLFTLSEVVVINRPGYSIEMINNDLGKKAHFADTPFIEISSTDIRRRVSEGKSIKYFVPLKTEDFIRENKIYK
jgi:nicotinate-nucleotide adenylyltransferase